MPLIIIIIIIIIIFKFDKVICQVKRYRLVNFYIFLGNAKNCNIYETVLPISTKFGKRPPSWIFKMKF